jgi:transposase
MLYVGIDLHRKRSQLAVVDGAGELVRSRRVRSRPDEVSRVFGELPKDEPVEAAFEATFGYGWLADLLADAGIPAHMAHPLATKAIGAGRVKNDKVDAAMLAQLLRANLLPEAWIAPLEAREARRMVRTRASLVRMRSRLMNQIHMVLADFALRREASAAMRSLRPAEAVTLFSKAGRRWLSEQALPEASRQRVEVNVRVMDGLDSEIKGVSSAIRERFARDERVRRLMPIPGIGLFTAATLVGEIWEVKRFPSPRRLASWAGLTPKEHSSGEHHHLGHISKQGSRWVRWVLVEAAAVHATKDDRLRELFNRVRRGKQERAQLAHVAVAHRLLTLCYYALRDEGGCRAFPARR